MCKLVVGAQWSAICWLDLSNNLTGWLFKPVIEESAWSFVHRMASLMIAVAAITASGNLSLLFCRRRWMVLRLTYWLTKLCWCSATSQVFVALQCRIIGEMRATQFLWWLTHCSIPLAEEMQGDRSINIWRRWCRGCNGLSVPLRTNLPLICNSVYSFKSSNRSSKLHQFFGMTLCRIFFWPFFIKHDHQIMTTFGHSFGKFDGSS